MTPRRRFAHSFCVAVILLLAAPVARGSLLIRVEPMPPCTARRLVATPLCSGQCPFKQVEVALTAPATPLDLDRSVRWTLRAEADQCWSEDVPVEGSVEAVSLRLWPAAGVRVRLRSSVGDLPTVVRLEARSAGAPERPFAGSVACPVVSGEATCVIPAAEVLDLRFEAAGFAPAYVFDADAVVEGKTTRLAALELVRGASIRGRVTDAGGGPVPDARVRLIPHNAEQSGQHRSIRTVEGRSNSRGFFQFTAVAEGGYAVEAEKHGLSSARAAAVVVEGETELVLAPLIQRPLQALQVWITPPADPFGRAWKLKLRRRYSSMPFATPPISGEATLAGSWEIASVEAGEYAVEVEDVEGNTRGREEVLLVDGQTTLVITLESIVVRGRVHLKDRPVPSIIRFRQPNGTLVNVTSDDQGEFTDVLPSPGTWRLTVVAKDRSLSFRRDADIRRTEADEKGYVSLDIALEEGTVSGEVVDAEGRPVSTGSVFVLRDHMDVAQGRIDAEGHFAIHGISPGPATLLARNSRGQSEALPVEITGETDRVRLRFENHREIRGWVRTPEGAPVAGAVVRFVSAAFMDTVESISGLTGSFVVTLPHTRAPVSMIVLPGSFPVKFTTTPGDAIPDRIDVVLSRAAGLLRIPLAPGDWPTVSRGAAPVSTLALLYPRDGSPYPRGLTRNGFELELEPGPYTVCAADGCASVVLPPNGEVSAHLPRKGK